MEKMQVRFERCKGCGLCVTVCPKQIVALQKEHRNEKGYFTAECTCLLYTSPSPRDLSTSRMPSSA